MRMNRIIIKISGKKHDYTQRSQQVGIGIIVKHVTGATFLNENRTTTYSCIDFVSQLDDETNFHNKRMLFRNDGAPSSYA